jgi:hypothetical protein
MTRFRNESGQTAVLTVLFLVALLGAVAMVLDVGSWYREQRDTQSAADAAALAAAQALPDSPGQASVLAAQYLAENGGGTPALTYSTKVFTNDTIGVEVTREAPGVFAKLFGIDSVTVSAKATARSGGLSAARWVAPITVNIMHPKLQCGGQPNKPTPCFGDATEITLEHLHKSGSGNAAGAFGLINLDQSDNGSVGGSTLGDWIERGFDAYLEPGIYTSVPSAKFNDSHVKGAMAARMNDDLLFPIYKTITGSGSNAEFDVVGWVGFHVTGFQANGSTGKVSGYFTEVLWEGIQSSTGNNANLGTRTVELVE